MVIEHLGQFVSHSEHVDEEACKTKKHTRALRRLVGGVSEVSINAAIAFSTVDFTATYRMRRACCQRRSNVTRQGHQNALNQMKCECKLQTLSASCSSCALSSLI